MRKSKAIPFAGFGIVFLSSMAKPPYHLDDTMSTPSSGTTSTAAAAAAAAARERQKKSTMACEMCRKRKVYLLCQFAC